MTQKTFTNLTDLANIVAEEFQAAAPEFFGAVKSFTNENFSQPRSAGGPFNFWCFAPQTDSSNHRNAVNAETVDEVGLNNLPHGPEGMIRAIEISELILGRRLTGGEMTVFSPIVKDVLKSDNPSMQQVVNELRGSVSRKLPDFWESNYNSL